MNTFQRPASGGAESHVQPSRGSTQEAMTMISTGNNPLDAQELLHLAIEQSGQGKTEAAAALLERALLLDPGLDIARFQLGVLYFSADRAEEASAAWKPLERLGEAHPLVLFKNGMEALDRDDFDACRRYFEGAIAANDFNPQLNAEMSRLLASLDEPEEESPT